MTYPVSSAWTSAIRSSVQRSAIVATIYRDDVPLLTVQPVAGSVTVDSTRAMRRDCSLTLVDYDGTLLPQSSSDPLTPYGNEIKVWRGLTFDDGTTELIPLGVFQITDIEITQEGQINVTTVDRSARISNARLTDTYPLPAGTLTDALDGFLRDRWGDAELVSSVDATITGGSIEAGPDSDPWAAAQSIASDFACDLAFDANGIAVLRYTPTPENSSVVATFVEDEDAVMLTASRAITAEGTYNGVIVTNSDSGDSPTIRAEAWDENPSSATYRYGSFGQRPRWYASSQLTTQADAQATADNMLAREVGLSERVAFSIVPDPSLEVFDVVTIQNAVTGISADYVIESFTVPLIATDSMTVVARQRVGVSL